MTILLKILYCFHIYSSIVTVNGCNNYYINIFKDFRVVPKENLNFLVNLNKIVNFFFFLIDDHSEWIIVLENVHISDAF